MQLGLDLSRTAVRDSLVYRRTMFLKLPKDGTPEWEEISAE